MDHCASIERDGATSRGGRVPSRFPSANRGAPITSSNEKTDAKVVNPVQKTASGYGGARLEPCEADR